MIYHVRAEGAWSIDAHVEADSPGDAKDAVLDEIPQTTPGDYAFDLHMSTTLSTVTWDEEDGP